MIENALSKYISQYIFIDNNITTKRRKHNLVSLINLLLYFVASNFQQHNTFETQFNFN